MKRLFQFFSCLLLLSMGSSADAAKVSLVTGGETIAIASFDRDKITYVSLTELAAVVGGSLDWETIGHRVTYAERGFRFDLLIGSPFFKLNDSAYNAIYPLEYRDGDLYVPARTFIPYIDRITPQAVVWDADKKQIRIESQYFNVTDLTFSPKANGILIELALTEDLPYDIFVTEGNWVNVSIRRGLVNIGRVESRFDRRILYDLKARQESGVAQVSFRLRQGVKNWYHALAENPFRIQISIPDISYTADSLEAIPAPDTGGAIDVIVIDPGHGGDDYGAIGHKGTREKDITLAIGRELAGLIRKEKQFKVVMTRNSDKTVSLQERADIANSAGADLFISIHANASPSRKANGWNVFFLAPAKNDSARSAEQLENSYFIREMAGDAPQAPETGPGPDEDTRRALDDPVLGILNEMLMTEFQEESADLAMMIDKQFRRRLNIPARGVDQAGFFVLNKVFTPSVLIESAFISNRAEEQLLKTASFQQAVAAGLYEAIKQFRDKYESQ